MSSCIITGCSLVLEPFGETYHGDLHEQGDQWIFNAVLDKDGEARLLRPSEYRVSKALVVSDKARYFVRRGVFIIPKENSELNAEARGYARR